MSRWFPQRTLPGVLAILVALLWASSPSLAAASDGDEAVDAATAAPFSHDALDRVLTRHVDARGLVAYAALARHDSLLNAYLRQLAACSPRRCRERFPTDADALAYWINAYNAFVLRGILDAWPVDRVDAVEGGLDGFFRQPRFVAGGDTLSLDHIENSIIRPMFRDPRIHFAVNCAALSCPALDGRAYRGADLDAHLDRQTRRFASDAAHVSFEDGRLRLSRIMDWYGEDFVKWFPGRQLDGQPSGTAPSQPGLVDYLLLYLPEDKARILRVAADIRIEFLDYDWSLNRQPATD